MKFLIEKLPDLRALYMRQLRLMLSAEEQIVRALPTMTLAATDAQLKQAFHAHEQDTELHIKRLHSILENIAGESDPIRCKVVAGLIDETEDQVQSCSHEGVRDAALIVGAQRIEHYEIASYGALRHFAQVLGRERDAASINLTIHEEGHADHLLTTIAERVNPAAQEVKVA